MPSILSVLSLGFILNCSSVPVKNPQIQREWLLVSFEDYAKQDLIKYKAGINLTVPVESGKIRGNAYMGCNRMFFSSEFKNNGTLKISGLGSTMMACPDMKLEDDFSKSFKNMTSYSLEGHFLTVKDDQGNTLKFVAADWD
ncbi:META domain-containing protein [Chryseobacterium sp. JJR-5R]|uniref:META domain-containing protein n=1 Tax=Chryseobacterium sp. JJR-5R TaxID=3093923 RepID=UPI002A762486|nr:META domain-containing protein [Chryseobacterium sp. JJR-5R]WPO82648.1 META domain-containing protein [Chryseobacterium sp. JJR-5R]